MASNRIRRWGRFIASGLLNTFFSYIAYLVFCILIDYQIAYFLAYVAGIVFSYFLNANFVFQTTISFKTFFKYPFVYVVQYICSATLLNVLVTQLSFNVIYAPLIVTAVMLPITYFLIKLILEPIKTKVESINNEQKFNTK